MNIDERKVRELILHARAYDVKEDVPDSSADRDSAEDVDLLRAGPGDPVRTELTDQIGRASCRERV